MSTDDTTCVVNIGPAERRRRRRLGLVSLFAATALLGGVWALGLPPVARLSASVLFLAGFSGILQARAKT